MVENPKARLTNEMAIKLVIKRNGDALESPPLDEKSFTEPLITIGSDAAASVCLNGTGVAPEQALIIAEDGQMLLINRADGTVLNDEELARAARRPLAHGDRLRIGKYVIILLLTQAEVSAETGEPSQTDLRSGGEAFSSSAEPAPQASPAGPARNGEQRPPRNFAAILDSLRTEEDSFYFLIEGGPQSGRRIAIESAEMPLGWDDTGQNLAFDPAQVIAPRAILRKDWSGVIVQAQGVGMVAVNGEPVESPRRLRNGDRLMVVPTAVTAAQNQSFLIFHEPASLVVLDSLLPQKLPPPVAAQPPAETNASLAMATQPPAPAAHQRAGMFDPQRRFFGYFTFVEILLMIAGTLVAAVVIFLVLEFTS